VIQTCIRQENREELRRPSEIAVASFLQKLINMINNTFLHNAYIFLELIAFFIADCLYKAILLDVLGKKHKFLESASRVLLST